MPTRRNCRSGPDSILAETSSSRAPLSHVAEGRGRAIIQDSRAHPTDGYWCGSRTRWRPGSESPARGAALMTRSVLGLIFGFVVLACSWTGLARAQAPVFMLSWGSLGSGEGQFSNPYG